MAYCAKCGKPYGDGAAFCAGCGSPVRPGAMTATAMPRAPEVLSLPRRRLSTSQRWMIVAIVAVLAVAAVAAAGFSFLGSAGLTGKAVVAFAKQYEGTWADSEGNKAIIDTSGGIARITIISGSDGELATVTVDGDHVSVVGTDGEVAKATVGGDTISADINGVELSLSKNKFD